MAESEEELKCLLRRVKEKSERAHLRLSIKKLRSWHPHAGKVMLKILQARLQQYVNCELPDVKLDLEKAEEP